MKTISGGTIRIDDAPRTAAPDAHPYGGEPRPRDVLLGPGRLTVLWNDRIVEQFALETGDALYVSDGDRVEPRTVLAWRSPWELPTLCHAAGIVRFSEATVEGLNEVTGLSTARFAPEGRDPVRIDVVGDVVRTYHVLRTARPRVRDGEMVERGAVLALTPRPSVYVEIHGLGGLRAFLGAVPLRERSRTARTAPFDGVVVTVDERAIVLEAADGRRRAVKRRRGQHVVVQEGDRVRAGDALQLGERSHHRLLTAWGPARLAAHLVGELEAASRQSGLAVPRAFWSVVVYRMLAWRRIVVPGDSGLRRHAVVARADFEALVRRIARRGGTPPVAVAALRGIRAGAVRRTRAEPSR